MPGREPGPGAAVHQTVIVESGFGYGVIGADMHVFQDRGPVYLLAEFQAATGGARPVPKQPSRLLHTRHEVVAFTGREQEQAELTDWRDRVGGPRLAVTWLHAPGGQGKTRLAAQFARQSAAEGWKVVTAVHGAGAVLPAAGSQDLRLRYSRGVLLIVDYADRWPASHLNWLFQNALLQHEVPTRVLLLARSVQPWAALCAYLEDQSADTDIRFLRTLPAGTDTGPGPGPGDRVRMFTAARDAFAACYGLGPKETGLIRPPIALDTPDFGLPLTLHMAALVAVDAFTEERQRAADAGRKPTPGPTPDLPTDPAGLSAYLLNRERGYWTRMHEMAPERVDFETPPRVMARMVFIAVLTGAMEYSQGRALLDGLGLELPADRLLADHATCYPPSDQSTVLEPLYPDRLAEDFLALTLPGHGIAVPAVAPWARATAEALTARTPEGAPPAHIARTITFLAAAAGPGRWPHVVDHLCGLLRADPMLAVSAGSAALTAVAQVPDLDPAVLEAVDAQVRPGPYSDLAPGAAAVAAGLMPYRLGATQDPAEHAHWYHELAVRQTYAGLHGEALDAVERAVAILRRLAEANPGAHGPDLAHALLTLRVCHTRLGRLAEAVAAAREAVAIWSPLAAADPAAFDSGLADALGSLGTALSTLGLHEEALEVAERAADIQARLTVVPGHPGVYAYGIDLAQTLHGLAVTLIRAGRYESALKAAQQAEEAYRGLAGANPRYEHDLATALGTLGVALAKLGRHADAVEATEREATVYRGLAKANPAAHEADLAGVLNNLSLMLARVGRLAEALAVGREAVETLRRSGPTNSAARLPQLAAALVNLGSHLAKAGRPAEGLSAVQEGVAAYRGLSGVTATACASELAQAYWLLAVQLSAAGRTGDALEASASAVGLWQKLAQADRGTHEPGLATALSDHGVHLEAAGRREEAVTAAERAVALHLRLVRIDPGRHEHGLAGAAANLRLFRYGPFRTRRAADPSDPAEHTGRTDLTDRTNTTDQGSNVGNGVRVPLGAELAELLDGLGSLLTEDGLKELGLACAEQAVANWRRLTEEDPSEHTPGLAESLAGLGACQAMSGRWEQAAGTTEEAVELWRGLARAEPGVHEVGLAEALSNLGTFAAVAGRWTCAAGAAEEAAAQWRGLVSEVSPAYEPQLAGALWSCAWIRLEGGLALPPAWTAVTESVAIYERLVRRTPEVFQDGRRKALATQAALREKLTGHRNPR